MRVSGQIKLILLEFGIETNTRLMRKSEKNLKDCYHTYLFNGSIKPFRHGAKGLVVQW